MNRTLGEMAWNQISQEALIRRLASEVLSGKAVSTACGDGSLMVSEVKLWEEGVTLTSLL